jgi:hypothetical protein
LWGIGLFYHKRWYIGKYGLGVFKEGIVIDNNLHREKYNVLLNRNLWFRIKEIKME